MLLKLFFTNADNILRCVGNVVHFFSCQDGFQTSVAIIDAKLNDVCRP